MGERRRAKDEEVRDCAAFFSCSLMILLVLFVYLVACAYGPDPPARYSVALGAVSGLGPAMDLQDGRALDPAFNLTVRVDATSRKKDGACLDESTSVYVSYLRVPLAVGRATDTACAEVGWTEGHGGGGTREWRGSAGVPAG
jgi:hypothetical protein